MVTIASFEGQVRLVEGFDIVVRRPDRRDARDDMRLDRQFGYVRASAGSVTVSQWKSGRFAAAAPGLLVDVLTADGNPVHGATQLKNVRSGYGPDPEQEGRWPVRWASDLEVRRMRRWAAKNFDTGRYLICPRCESSWLHPFDLDPLPKIPGTRDPATHHCTYCGWHGYRMDVTDRVVSTEDDLISMFTGAQSLDDVADSISDSYTDEDIEIHDLEYGVELHLGATGLELPYPFSYQEFWDVIQYLEDIDMEEFAFATGGPRRFSSSSG